MKCSSHMIPNHPTSKNFHCPPIFLFRQGLTIEIAHSAIVLNTALPAFKIVAFQGFRRIFFKILEQLLKIEGFLQYLNPSYVEFR